MNTIIPTLRSIEQLLRARKFAIDDYQREYKWESKQIIELLDDLYGKFSANYLPQHATSAVANYEPYYLGSIIISDRQGHSYLIDGQQRVTSLTLLLIFLHHLQVQLALPGQVNLTELIYSDDYGKKSFNLDIPDRFLVLTALFNRDPFDPTDQDESIQTMYARYDDIEKQFPDSLRGLALIHFVYWLIRKVVVIEIAASSDEDAYAIFETMNDRGKPLSSTDMLKAYLLANIDDVSERGRANTVWKDKIATLRQLAKEGDADFIKAWLRARYANTIRDRQAGAENQDFERIATQFHKWVRDNRVRLGLKEPQHYEHFIATVFTRYTEVYERIWRATETLTPGLEAIYYNAHNDFTLQDMVLLAPLSDADDADTVTKKLRVTASYIDIYIIRHVVNYIRVSYSSVYYAMFQLSKSIREQSLPNLVTILQQRLASDDAGFYGSKSRGRTGILDLGLNQFSKRYIHHILARLTAHIEVQSGRPNYFADYVDPDIKNPYEIEHIWSAHPARFQQYVPKDTEFWQVRDNLGGLLLLPRDFNRSFQDKPYAQKLPHYQAQNLLARSLHPNAYHNNPQFLAYQERSKLPFKPYDEFDLAAQLERRELYRQIGEEIWSPERLQREAGL